MYCDSAVLYRPQNTFEAFGNVRVRQADTVLITGEELTYEGDKRTFTITDNVVLKTPSSKLATKVLKYDRNTSTAYYLTRSTLERKELRITSDVGNYNTEYEAFSTTITIPNLEKVYYFRAIASNSGGTVVSRSLGVLLPSAPVGVANLLGRWNFDSENANDSSGTGRHGTAKKLFSPSEVSSMKLWLDAADSSTNTHNSLIGDRLPHLTRAIARVDPSNSHLTQKRRHP